MKFVSFYSDNRTKAVIAVITAVASGILSLLRGDISLNIVSIMLIMSVYSRIRYRNHRCFLVMMLLYGFFARMTFTLAQSAYNPVFMFPIMYMMIFADDIYSNMMKLKFSTRIGIAVYLFIGIVFALLVNYSYIMTQAISFTVMILPVLFAVMIGNTDEIKHIITIAAPLVFLAAITQYFGLFVPWDTFWIEQNALKTYDSMRIAGNIRPFSVFSSVEELGFFLLFLAMLPLHKPSKQTVFISVISVIMLFVFSIRLPLIIFVLAVLFMLLKRGKKRVILIILVFFLILTAVLNIVPFKESIHVSESGPEVFIRHSLEPFRNVFQSYSFRKRMEFFSTNVGNFIDFPWGMGLNSNPRILKHSRNIYDSESAFIMLILSCGFIMLLFLGFIVFKVSAALIRNQGQYLIYWGFAALIMLFFSHALNFHFMNIVFYSAFIGVIDGL